MSVGITNRKKWDLCFKIFKYGKSKEIGGARMFCFVLFCIVAVVLMNAASLIRSKVHNNSVPVVSGLRTRYRHHTCVRHSVSW